jgi:quinol monooxygenase YgiN
MKAVKVQYTVKPEFIEQNKRNIEKVMAKLRENPIDGMLYSSFTDETDPSTFIHINIARDASAFSKLNELGEFNAFRVALKESGPVSPPKQSNLNPVDAGFIL